MKIEFDARKSAENALRRGLPFDRALDFDFATALMRADERRDYGEPRLVAVGFLDARLHVLCFTVRTGRMRVKTQRRANAREVKAYAEIHAKTPAGES